MDKGYIILAQNTEKINYVQCAEMLARSIKYCMPDANITLISDDTSSPTDFDQVVKLPYGDLAANSEWKLINDWQVYEASPYEYTIKLEADMIIPRSIDYWWNVLKQQDVVISTTIREFRQSISPSRVYRRFIDDNSLPDCYNAITYFKKSPTAEYFFNIVRNVFENWDQYKTILKCNPKEEASTDWVYAIACHIIGLEKTTLPNFTEMSMVHMKGMINNLQTDDWTDSLIYELLPDAIRINTFPQLYPFHYHIKSFSDKLIESDYAR